MDIPTGVGVGVGEMVGVGLTIGVGLPTGVGDTVGVGEICGLLTTSLRGEISQAAIMARINNIPGIIQRFVGFEPRFMFKRMPEREDLLATTVTRLSL